MPKWEENTIPAKDLCDISGKLAYESPSAIKVLTEGDELYSEMLEAINLAEREILLESYIFALDDVGRQFINGMARHYYARLAREAIRVYTYRPRMLHAKTMVVDSREVMVGSANMDYRSLFTNFELVCLFASRDVAARLTEQFEQDSQQSEQIGTSAKTLFGALWFYRPLVALFKHLF